MNKKDCINHYKDLQERYPNAVITRDFFVKNSPVTKHQLHKNGGFGGIKRAVTEDPNQKLSELKLTIKQTINNELNRGGAVLEEKPKGGSGLEYDKRYVYNKADGKYIFLLQKQTGKNIVLDEDTVKSIIKGYSNYDGSQLSINQAANRFDIPRRHLIHILKILGITHDSIPVTNEDLADKDTNELIEEILQEKRFNLDQKLNKREWEETRRDANHWREFLHGVINPIESALDNWKPFTSKKIKSPNNKSEESLVLGLSDLHFGESATGDYMFSGKDWGIDDAHNTVIRYVEEINSFIKKRKSGFNRCDLAVLGDLVHGITGMTDKGTILEAHPKGSKQFTYALNSLIIFFNNLLEKFNEINVTSVGGNHDNFADFALMTCLESHYRNESRISFNVSSCRWAHFKVDDNLFLIEHGYSHRYKSKVPSAHASRENYINNLILKKPEMRNAKNKYFIMGDRHHVEIKEYSNFEFFQFSTPVGGNEYADNSNWGNRPRQNGLVVSEKGVTEFVNFYV